MNGNQTIREILATMPFDSGLFGSCLEKPLSKASDIDLVMEKPNRHMKMLKNLARETGKPLDIFLPPLMEEERTSKVYVTPDGNVARDCVYCGKGFFDGIILIRGISGSQKHKERGKQAKGKGERHE